MSVEQFVELLKGSFGLDAELDFILFIDDIDHDFSQRILLISFREILDLLFEMPRMEALRRPQCRVEKFVLFIR